MARRSYKNEWDNETIFVLIILMLTWGNNLKDNGKGHHYPFKYQAKNCSFVSSKLQFLKHYLIILQCITCLSSYNDHDNKTMFTCLSFVWFWSTLIWFLKAWFHLETQMPINDQYRDTSIKYVLYCMLTSYWFFELLISWMIEWNINCNVVCCDRI